MNCLICGNNDLKTVDTVVSEFVADRIKKIPPPKAKLCFCEKCTFAFYNYRFTDEESKLLYEDYRGNEYQSLREKYEYWYSAKVNKALNNDMTALSEQQRVITKIIKENIHQEIKVALDYGGNEGRTFVDLIGAEEKYVFDISGVPTISGVKNISNPDELKNHSWDFIMCNMLFEHLADPIKILSDLEKIGDDNTYYYIEVPSENPFVKQNKFSIWKNIRLLGNPLYKKWNLIRYYFKQRTMPFMPMKEHVNFFTVQSMRIFVENNGFQVIDIQENMENTILGEQLVLSVLFQKNKNK